MQNITNSKIKYLWLDFLHKCEWMYLKNKDFLDKKFLIEINCIDETKRWDRLWELILCDKLRELPFWLDKDKQEESAPDFKIDYFDENNEKRVCWVEAMNLNKGPAILPKIKENWIFWEKEYKQMEENDNFIFKKLQRSLSIKTKKFNRNYWIWEKDINIVAINLNWLWFHIDEYFENYFNSLINKDKKCLETSATKKYSKFKLQQNQKEMTTLFNKISAILFTEGIISDIFLEKNIKYKLYINPNANNILPEQIWQKFNDIWIHSYLIWDFQEYVMIKGDSEIYHKTTWVDNNWENKIIYN